MLQQSTKYRCGDHPPPQPPGWKEPPKPKPAPDDDDDSQEQKKSA